MRACVFFSLVLLLASVQVTGQDYPGSSGSESIIVRSWHFTTLNEAPMSASGDALDVACAAPPAINMGIGYGQPFLLVPSANTTLVGEHGIYGAGAISNLAQRASFESFTGDDPDGWTVTETAGDGTAAITEETTIVAHGGSSVKMVLTGTTSEANITSDWCITCTASTCDYDMYLDVWIKKAGGTSSSYVVLYEYDTDACGGYLAAQNVINGQDVTTSWVNYDALIAAASYHADTSSVKIRLSERGDGGVTTYWDAVQLREASTPTDGFCPGDTDATSVCNLIDMTDVPPEHMVGTWEFEATIRSPIDGAVVSTKTIMFAPATAGNNNKIFFFLSGDVLFCDVYDSAGNQKRSTVAAAYNADTDYTVKMSKDALTGTVQCCFDGTCDAAPATGAFTDGIGSEIVFGSTGFTGGEVWIQDPVIRRRLTP